MLSRKYIFMTALLAVIVAIAAAPQITLADHPDNCLRCHADTANDRTWDVIDGTNYTYWSHDIYTGDTAWANCRTCHANLYNNLQNTVHTGIGCRCHAVAHAGYDFGGPNVFGAAFFSVLNTSGVGDFIAPPKPFSFLDKYVTYDERNISDAFGYTPSMDVEVGLVQLFGTASGNPEYMQVNATNNYLVCFNCHFLATDPSTVGAFKFVEGAWKIGIPETALSLPPHEITGVELASAGESSGPSIPVIFSMGVGLLGAGLVLFAGRRK